MVRRRFVETRSGVVHVAEAGDGPPVLLLHQTPRSWDEFRDVLPLVGRGYRAIAMDTRGFGDSDPLPAEKVSIEGWAEAVSDLADALGLDRMAVVGHHTGAAIAVELAARAPDRVRRLVLSASPFVDAERRRKYAALSRVVDEVEPRADGGHLLDLWEGRRSLYPDGAIDLLERFVRDALKAGPMAAEGHRVVNRYRMEGRFGKVACPTLVLAPTEDPHAFPNARRVAAAIAGARVLDIPGGMVPLPDQMPEVFAAAVVGFLDETGPWA